VINIFLINWFCLEDIKFLLQSLEISEYKKFRVIIVNNSKEENDELGLMIKSFFETIEIHTINSSKNTGYSGGNNLALSYINKNKLSGDILISNSDVIFNSLTIGNLFSGLSKKGIGAVSPRIFNSKNQHIFDVIKLKGFQQKYVKTDLLLCDTDYVPGCCFMIKRELVNKIGLFDEKFFMYWEEVDLSFRILKEGYRIICCTESSINRKDNSDESYINSIKFSTRNSFILKHKHNLGEISHIIYLITMLMLSIIKSLKIRDYKPIKSFFLGFFEGWNKLIT
tara:strand:+ start:316 stop:1161 length:846 start_codon:yes stop_codon:yes gene_type:complete